MMQLIQRLPLSEEVPQVDEIVSELDNLILENIDSSLDEEIKEFVYENNGVFINKRDPYYTYKFLIPFEEDEKFVYKLLLVGIKIEDNKWLIDYNVLEGKIYKSSLQVLANMDFTIYADEEEEESLPIQINL